MTMILIDGFDHMDASDVWTSTSLIAHTTPTVSPRTGLRAAGGGGAGGPSSFRALSTSEIDDGVTMGIACWMGSSGSISGFAAGASGGKLVFREDAITHIYAQFRSNTRAIELFRGSTLLATTDTNIFTFDTWNYLELGVKIADTGGVAEVRLNGVTVLTYAGDTRNGGTSGVINSMGFIGNGDVGSPQVVLFDDAYLLNEQGSAPWNTFLGDTRCYPLYPNGNGFYSQLLGSDADSVNNYQLVDEVGTPSTVDYVGSVTVDELDTYTFEDISDQQSLGTISAVESRIYAAKTETGTKQIRLVVRRSGADAYGPNHVLAQSSYATYRYIMQLDPHAGPGAWTIPNVDDTEFGAQVRS